MSDSGIEHGFNPAQGGRVKCLHSVLVEILDYPSPRSVWELSDFATHPISVSLGEETPPEELHLSNNPITGTGLALLRQALASNHRLKVPNTVQCKIDAAGFGEFCQTSRGSESLVKVMSSHKAIRDDGATQYAEAIKVHPTLKDVDLEWGEIDDAGCRAIFGVLAVSPAIEQFSVRNDLIMDGVYAHGREPKGVIFECQV